MNFSTNPCFTHGIDKLCTICHVILTDTAHSIFSTLEELESPMNVLQVLQSFSNFNFYNGTQMVCTTCYNKTIDVYKFIQMCNKSHENMQHYLKYLDIIKTIKDETDVDVKVEEISTSPTTIIFDGREFAEKTENEIISKFDELGMGISGTQIKIEERTLSEELEKEEGSNYQAITISHAEIVTEEKIDSSDFDNLNVEIIDEQLHDERMGLDKSNLHTHIQVPTAEKKFTCLICKRGFTASSSLRRHVDTHNEVKPHKCEQCDRRFSQAAYLRRHMHVHTGIKAHKCEQCDRRFIRATQLRSHMDTHNGVKAHKCVQCDRRFNLASDLRRHMDIHNGVKAHKCEQCDRQFTHPSNLRRHMDIHYGTKAHKCELCDRRFTQAVSLRRHMDIHNEVKAHKCEQCDRRFTHPSNLRRHMMIHNRTVIQM